MKPMITISLTKEEAEKLTKILYNSYCDDKVWRYGSFKNRLLDDLVDLLEVKPWDL